MRPAVVSPDESREFSTPERCLILEVWNTPNEDQVSIARARVKPGVRTILHLLEGNDERYLIIEGHGVVEVEDSRTQVGPGTVVIIPRDTPQRIENTGTVDLVFYCINTPPFTTTCYRDLETGQLMPPR